MSIMFTNESLMLSSRARRRHTRSAWGHIRVTVPVIVPQVTSEPQETVSETDVVRDGDTVLCARCGHQYPLGELFTMLDGPECYSCKVLGESQIA